jgi:hypothetical protein
MHFNIYSSTLTYIHTYIHTCIHTCIHTYIHAYIHTYMSSSMQQLGCFVESKFRFCLRLVCRYSLRSAIALSQHTHIGSNVILIILIIWIWHVCMYICIYVYVDVSRRMVWYAQMNIIISAHTYIHTYIHTCMHACMHTYIHFNMSLSLSSVWFR